MTTVDGELVVNHIPFLLDPTRGPLGTLVGHVARANRVWKTASTVESVVVFQGPQHYVSPGWYPSTQEHGKVVPTWNYAVVHAHGTPRVVDDRAWLRRHVGELTDVHEGYRAEPWRVADAPPSHIETLLQAIVGIEIEVSRLVGKWKTSQNRSPADRRGVVAGLEGMGDTESRRMAALVRERGPASDD